MLNYARKSAHTWKRFSHLSETRDAIANEQQKTSNWSILPYVGFIVPIEAPRVQAQLVAWQHALEPWLSYPPVSPERLHITLHHIGGLRQHAWSRLPNTWARETLPQLAHCVRNVLEAFPPFEIGIGPLNAFSTVLFAEVQDPDRCLQLLRARIRRALPLRARPAMTWAYLPHVTLGFWGRQPAGPIIEALRSYRQVEPFPMRVQRVKFTIYVRDTVPHDHIKVGQDREEVIETFKLQGE